MQNLALVKLNFIEFLGVYYYNLHKSICLQRQSQIVKEAQGCLTILLNNLITTAINSSMQMTCPTQC